MKKIGIIGAMEVEVQTLVAQLENEKTTEAGKLVFYEGKLNGVDVVIVRSGVGKVNAALCAQRLILQFGVTHIINTGVAGATVHGARILDIVVSTDAVYHDVDVVGFGYKPMEIPQMKKIAFEAEEKMIAVVEKAFHKIFAGKHKLFKGRVASGDQFISSKEKRDLIVSLAQPACVEMEGAAIAHTCYLSDIPFVIIRSLSDNADEGAEELNNAWTEKESAEQCAVLTAEVVSLL